VSLADGAASARDPTAPSAVADPGLVLVRGPDRPDLQDETKGWIMSVKLTDAQLVMMSAAAQRKDRCLSVPPTIKGAALSKVRAKLAKLGLAREIEAKPGAPIWRRDDAGQGYALKSLRSDKDRGAAMPFDRRAPQTRDGVGLTAGALLAREWNGKLERVMILEEGFAWNGQTFGSLSQIAKAMTGTNWNGHRFFGLRQGKAAAPDKDRSRRNSRGRATATAAGHGAPSGEAPCVGARPLNDQPF